MPKIVKAKSWVELRVEVPSSWAEGVSNFLIELGSPGVIQEDASRGKKESILAYLPKRPSYAAKRTKLRKYLTSLMGRDFYFKQRVIREEKWAEKWKANFRTFHATPKIVVKPPWEEYRERKGEIVITIDPGMAFGTGTHPTTRMCLQALDVLIPSFVPPPSVLDFGTGSGILAIAAQKLGAKDTVAVDIDPAAIQNARMNTSANRPHGRIDFRVGSGQSLRRRFGIVVANLLPQEVLNAADLLAKRVSPAGCLVLSGILKRQETEIASILTEKGLKVHASKTRRGWICMVFKRKPLSRVVSRKS
jgi:ribosomal protein L11 methyltransferase